MPPRGRLTADEALNFGSVLSVFSILTLGVLVNWTAGILLAITIGFSYLFSTINPVPHLLPDLQDQQRAALAANVKAPLVYANVALRRWQPFIERGVHILVEKPIAPTSTERRRLIAFTPIRNFLNKWYPT